LLVLTRAESVFRFRDLPPDALPSLLRDFSAPVALDYQWSPDDLARLAGHDPDAFNRWRACRRLAEQVLDQAIADDGRIPDIAGLLEQSWASILDEGGMDAALVAELLVLPSEFELVQQRDPVDVDAVHRAHKQLLDTLCESLKDRFESVWRRSRDTGPWSGDGSATARRRLKNLALACWCRGGHSAGLEQAEQQFAEADNMTDRLAALKCLVEAGGEHRTRALQAFEARHGSDALVMDKWFAVQAGIAETETVEQIVALMEHPAFSLKNPNKVRALLGSFSHHNPRAFHRADGAGYRLLGQAIRDLDALNPQVAARLATAFNRWHTVDAQRAEQMRAELERIRKLKSLSPDVGEIVAAALRNR
jgi:aminopeptidase N